MKSNSSHPNKCVVSNIYCVDPLSFQLEDGKITRCIQLWKVGNDQLLLVGTSFTRGNSIMTTGETKRYI